MSSTTTPAKRAAKRARQSPGGGTAVGAAMQELIDEAMDELMEILEREPNKVALVLRFAKKSPAEMEPKANPDADAPFHHTYRKLWRYPKECAQAYLTEIPRFSITMDIPLLKLLEKGEDDVSRKLWYFAHDCDGTAPWPQFAHNKQVFKQCFAAIYEECGRRLDGLKINSAESKVDWMQFGAYVFLPVGGFPKTEIKHISGKTASLEDAGLSIAEAAHFSVSDNWHTMKAEARYKKNSVRCIDLFPDDFKQLQKQRLARVKEWMQKFANEAQAKVCPMDVDDGERKLSEAALAKLSDQAEEEEEAPPADLPKGRPAASKKTAKK